MKIAILGYARQGKSSYEYYNLPENDITICDQNLNAEVPKQAKKRLGPNYLQNLNSFDLIIRTSNMHPKLIKQANPNSPDILSKVTSNTNEFFRVCPSKNIIAVTGTKGKSTTSTLIAKMLEAQGLRTHLGGNIGIPPLELLKNNIKPNDWVVLELASYQLIDLNYSPHIGLVLMLDEDHLDWHKNFDEYLKAKANLFNHQTTDDIAVYFADNQLSKQCTEKSLARKIPYYKRPGAYVENNKIAIENTIVCDLNSIALIGGHNIQNICAALTVVWQIQQNIEAIKKIITDFSGLPLHLEKRRTLNGTEYINDSFASNPSATIAAIKAIKQPKILIIGGKDRNLKLDKLVNEIRGCNTIKKVVVIGESTTRIAKEFNTAGFSNYEITDAKTMKDIVLKCANLAARGDAVVLSPGFPSFDMFKNFEDRGEQFNKAIDEL